VRPVAQADELVRLIDILNPGQRTGAHHADQPLRRRQGRRQSPALVRAVKREGRTVVWSCDPMHGNTISAESGYKTRPFDRILQEVKTFFDVHTAEGTHGGGVHLEMTGKDVTECTGGARAISDQDLNDRYHTLCDPRLNAEQAIELAFLLAELLKAERAAKAKPMPAAAGL
jgi:3-deoxy-7-phosphoheptulonate synthase